MQFNETRGGGGLVEVTLRYRFKTRDREPRPRSRSNICPTSMGSDWNY